MRLYHDSFSIPIFFEENIHNVLVVENPTVLSNYILELKDQIGGFKGNFIFSDKKDDEELEENVCLIVDPFSLNLNSKEFISKLNENLKKELLQPEYAYQIEELNQKISKILGEISLSQSMLINYDCEFSPTSLLKISNVFVESTDSSLLNHICNYLELSSLYLGKKLYIFVNLKQFLSEKEVSLFYDYLDYNKIDDFC